MLQFFFESSAEQFAFDFSQKCNSDPRAPRVTHLKGSPTYPLSPTLKSCADRRCSRRIAIHQVRPDAYDVVCDALEGNSFGFRENGWIVTNKFYANGNLEITFNSLLTAVYAFNRLRCANSTGELECSNFGFVRDYGEDEELEKSYAKESSEDRSPSKIPAQGDSSVDEKTADPATALGVNSSPLQGDHTALDSLAPHESTPDNPSTSITSAPGTLDTGSEHHRSPSSSLLPVPVLVAWSP